MSTKPAGITRVENSIAPRGAPITHGARHLGKGLRLVCQQRREDIHAVFELIEANRAELPVATMCKVLKVSKSGFYDWRVRPPSARTIANVVLTEKIKAIHKMSNETYGMPRIWAELLEAGVRAARTRIARLMRQANLQGASGRSPRRFVNTAQQNKTHEVRTDLVNRNFVASGINQLWVADITYVPTWAGFVYLAIVLDAYSRKVVG